ETEKADLERELHELSTDEAFELQELTEIYRKRGLEESLAQQVAKQLMANDALAAHARDELGLTEIHAARPIQAALASAVTFAVGASLPLLIALISPINNAILFVSIGSLLSLALLGALSARAGGAKVAIAVGRVTFWGALAMAATAVIGKLFGTVV
ncbi:MAG: VIT1/CCC1 transporter family protein, partial [Anaerolineae bacterium]